MLILIAESKTMRADVAPVSAEEFIAHKPLFEDIADGVAARLRGLSRAELAAELGLGPKSSAQAFDDYYSFPDKSTGLRAIEAFTGVVFKSFGYSSLNEEQRAFADRHIRIVSSLYGLLRPGDIVKPYRLDFDSKVMDGGTAPKKFWRAKVTVQLAKAVADSGDAQILDLLPKDASDCIDWKTLKRFAKTGVAEFKVQGGDRLATPAAGKLKTMRGDLLREIVVSGTVRLEDLSRLEPQSSVFDSESPYPGHYLFVGA